MFAAAIDAASRSAILHFPPSQRLLRRQPDRAAKSNTTAVKDPDGTDQLFDVEFLVFDNGTVAV